MRPPFPSAAQAYAESIDSATASRHHPDARLTILPLPSLAALYPLDSHPSPSHSSSSASNHNDIIADSSHRNLQVRLLHGNHQQQPAYQSYGNHFQKVPAPLPNLARPSMAIMKQNSHEYLGANMESLLDAIEVHPALSTSSSPSRSPSPSGSFNSLSSAPTSPLSSPQTPVLTANHIKHVFENPAKAQTNKSNSNKGRMSISNLVDNNECENIIEDNKRPRLKPMVLKASSPTFIATDINKRKWSNLSSANFEEERNAKIRRSIQDHVAGQDGPSRSSSESTISIRTRQEFDSADPSTRYQMTTICCLHASVAQKSYGSEKRFLCPPPTVHIQAPQDNSSSGLSNKPQVTMSVICDSADGNSTLGQRSTLEDDQSSTFRYLYVTGTAKAKSFQLKLQVYGRACLPNGFISTEGDDLQSAMVHNAADLPEPYAVFDSAPIAIISKPSKKTAKARNVSSCILAGSLVSLFNRINSQTVRTKYMSVQDGEFCAKNSTWSAFSVTIVSNGPSCPDRLGLQKSHHRQSNTQASSPITYGAEIILTETATGIQSDRLIVCKVENGKIVEDATGPICQMQKVALQSTERNKDGQAVYLSAVGNDHQVGRYMDHSTTAKTVLRYQPSNMAQNSKLGSDDFLCWTIVGISKFEYTYFESLPANTSDSDSESGLTPQIPHPITPFPTLLKNPVYNAASHTLELVVSNFYSQIGDQPSQVPMHVWLGSRGPLSTHIIRRNVSNGTDGDLDQTTLLVDLPQGKQMGVEPEDKTITLPLLFVRHSDGITYNSRAKVVFTRTDESDRWNVAMT
ncbi:hypothetical protein BG006_004756 [Podila minutissima]|uniref:Uncharacterized protein n=1 Tax=Podila minutissima TaxID=64525 RepID=A0A9P5VMH7_9FUNG|nr:hypothetical protein BG006_004756 [Podila minutissima]